MDATAQPGSFNRSPPGHTFLLVWLGQFVSLTGSVMTRFGLAIWVFSETGSTMRLAFVVLAGAVPAIVISPIAGSLVDRWDRRQAMIVADTGAALGTAVIAVLLATGRLETWQLYLALAWSSAFSAFQFPAFSAATATLVPKTQLGRAAGLVELSASMGYVIAPALAGVIVASTGLVAIFAIDLVTFAVAIVTLLLVRMPRVDVPYRGPVSLRGLLRDAVEGWVWVRSRRGLLGLLATFAVVGFAFGFVEVLLVPLLLSVSSAAVAGVTVSVSALGLVAGSLLMATWGGSSRRVRDLHVALMVMGAGLVVAGVRPWPLLILLAITVAHMAVPIARGTNQAIWLSSVPAAFQGRVAAVRQMISSASTPLALLAAGYLAEHVFDPALADGALSQAGAWLVGTGGGRGTALLLMVAGVVIVATALASWRSRAIRELGRDLERDAP